LLDIGEIHRVPPEDEKIYIVSDKHIEHLKAQNLPYEEVSLQTFLANFSLRKKSLIKRNNWRHVSSFCTITKYLRIRMVTGFSSEQPPAPFGKGDVKRDA